MVRQIPKRGAGGPPLDKKIERLVFAGAFWCYISKWYNTGEQIVGVVALNRPGLTDRSRVKAHTFQQDLSLDCDGDLHVVLAFAEKIQPNTYIDETLSPIVKLSSESLRHF